MTADSMNILVVDDEQIVLDSINKHLRKEDCTVHAVLSVEAALKLMGEIEIDIVLTDLMMPDIDGMEFMKMVKDRRPNTPVIIVTGYATVSTAQQATQLGAFDYVAKPFAKSELLGVIHRAFDAVRHANGAGQPADGGAESLKSRAVRSIGSNSWIAVQEDGTVRLGVEHSFVQRLGKVQTIHLPDPGDELARGSVYLKVFSSDLTSHPVVSPLSGTVVDVNRAALTDPNAALEDPYHTGWLIRLKPSRLEEEMRPSDQ